MEKELLTQALNSILHGSTQIVSSTDSYGNMSSHEIRVNDLRVPLIEKIALGLCRTDAFKEVFVRAFTPEIIKQIQDKAIADVKFSDLPYDIRQKIERQMKDAGVEVRKYTIIAESVVEKKED